VAEIGAPSWPSIVEALRITVYTGITAPNPIISTFQSPGVQGGRGTAA
jgi:hypothetical protein